jgi:hypothetical protein
MRCGDGSAQRGHAIPARGMSMRHAVHSNASPLGAAHSTHACGSALRSSAVHARHVPRVRTDALVVTLSNFAVPKFDSMR